MRHVLTILAVDDVDRAAAFYAAAFDCSERVRAPVYVELALDDGRALGLYARAGFARNTGRPSIGAPPPSSTTATELYFRCEPDALAAAIACIEKAGAELLSPCAPRDWGDDAAYYRDPDGNVLVIAASSSPSP